MMTSLAWVAKARPHTVGVFKPRRDDVARWQFMAPVPLGTGDCADDWFIYWNPDDYDAEKGLVLPEEVRFRYV